ncbi:DUF424 domain-containing protein [Candidatus Woesearchaeota archaeon]|nr:DUF424 domain-containing protein [Candidatus Woesearchaeota archaeon]
MIVKTHATPNGKLIAICDSDILGKKFEEGDRQLDLSGGFYRGSEVPAEQLERMLKSAYLVNAVGKRSVDFLIGKKLVDPSCILRIAGVPCAQSILPH